ncbi:MAG: hypothetical protein CFE34_15285 [Rhodobacteraceae bacterium PARR1]|nr:MAG: hypothetical protein CFE34_15285 [Rhodobacteraceae bacterium PARR1]
MKVFVPALLSAAILLSACQEDPNAAANKLFVGASTALTEAGTIDDSVAGLEKRKAALTVAVDNLGKILKDVPESDLAVELASAGSAKGLNLTDLKAELAAIDGKIVCVSTPNKLSCLRNEMASLDPAKLNDIGAAALSCAYSADGNFEKAFGIAKTHPEFERNARGDELSGSTCLGIFSLSYEGRISQEIGQMVSSLNDDINSNDIVRANERTAGRRESLKLQSQPRLLDDADLLSVQEKGGTADLSAFFSTAPDFVVKGDSSGLQLLILSGFAHVLRDSGPDDLADFLYALNSHGDAMYRALSRN